MIAVVPFMRQLFTNGFTPEKLAGLPVNAQDIKTVNELGLRIDDDGQWFAPLNFHARLGNGFGVGLDSGGLGQ